MLDIEEEDGRDRSSDEAESQVEPFDGILQDALRDHAARGAIRKVHLRGDDIQLLTTIISTLPQRTKVPETATSSRSLWTA